MNERLNSKKKSSNYKDESTLDENLERYARQILIDDWDQDKLSNSTIFIAGVGALGTVIALNLVLMGIKNLILCDYDTIEMSNLSRQLLFFEEDIGKYKVDAAKKNLEHWNPNINIITYNCALQKIDNKVFEESDILIDGLDTFGARRWLNSVAVDLGKPLIHGGIFGWFGNVQIVIPEETACLECQPLIPQKRLQKPCTPLGEVRKKERGKIDKEIEEKIPSILTTAAIIAGIQSQIVIKLLMGFKISKENYIFYDGLSNSFTKMALKKNDNCIVCSDKYRVKGINFSISDADTVRKIKDRIIMTWDLREPFNFMFKGRILDDNVEIKNVDIKNKDVFFIWNRGILHPMKFYAIFSSKVKPIVVSFQNKPKDFELMVKWGTITQMKQKIIKEASTINKRVKFYKTIKLSDGNYLLKYKKYSIN